MTRGRLRADRTRHKPATLRDKARHLVGTASGDHNRP